VESNLSQPATTAAARTGLRLAHLWLLVPLALIFVLAARDVIETFDFWWNAKSGEWMVQQGQILLKDILVYSPARAGTYYNPQWLAQVILYLLYAAGPATLLLFRALLFSFVIGLAIWHSLRRSNSYRIASLIGVLTIFTGFTNMGIRPQMLVFPLFISYYFILFASPYRGSIASSGQPSGDSLLAERGSVFGIASGPLHPRLGWKVFLLPPLMVLWVNMHGSYFLGLILIGIYVVATLIDHLRQPGERAWLRSGESIRQAVAFALTGLAVFVNPYLFGIIEYFFVATSDPTARRLNSEWQPPTIYNGTGLLFLLNLLVFGLSLYYSRRRLNLADALLTLAFLYLSLLSLRNVVWWGLISGPIIAANLAYRSRQTAPALPTADQQAEEAEPLAGTVERPLFNYLIAGMLLAVCLLFVPYWRVPLIADSEAGYYDASRPKAIADYLSAEVEAGRLEGRIFNYMEWGGYLEYRLYPRKQMFIDGRFEARTENVWQDYIRISAGFADWQLLLRNPDYGDIRWLVLDATYQKNLVTLLNRQGSGWRRVLTEYVASSQQQEPLGYLYQRIR